MIETVYRGHTIVYNDNNDTWLCRDADFTYRGSPKLSNVKAQIDKMYLGLRETTAIMCFEIPLGGNSDPIPAKVTEYVRSRSNRNYRGGLEPACHFVASVAQRGGSSKPSRAEQELCYLMPDTVEARAAYVKWQLSYASAELAKAQADEAKRKIPRLSKEDIQPLIDLKSKMNTMEKSDDAS